MANVRNFGLVGIGSDVRLGKTGPRIVVESGDIALRNIGGSLINVLAASPVSADHVATKQYVDNAVQGLDGKEACYYGTAAVLPNSPTYDNGVSGVGATLTATVNGVLVIDGVTMTGGDVGRRVLVKDQVNQAHNGIYTITNIGSVSSNYILTRSTDFDESSEVVGGSFTFVQAGNTVADTGWLLTLPDGSATIGTTNLVFTQFSSAGVINVDSTSAITKTGNIISAAVDGVTIGKNTVGPNGQLIVRSSGTSGQILRSTGVAGDAATWGALDLANSSSVSGILPVANGGTGASSLTANQLLLGNGTSAVTTVSGGTTNQVLTSNGSSAPAFAWLGILRDSAGNARVNANTADITMSHPVLNAAGSASAPSISFSADPDTGMYSAGANSIGFATNGVLRMTIDNSGVTVGSSGAGNIVSDAGQDMTVAAGDSTSAGAGANLVLQGGLPTDGNGGNVNISARNGVGTNRDGGDIVLTPGSRTGTGDPGIVQITGSSALQLPSGNDAARPTAANGMIRYSTQDDRMEAYVNGAWVKIMTSAAGILAVSAGGTGASSFTANGVIFGNGTSALQVTAAGSANQVLVAGPTPAFQFLGTLRDSAGLITVSSNGVASANTNIRISNAVDAAPVIEVVGGTPANINLRIGGKGNGYVVAPSGYDSNLQGNVGSPTAETFVTKGYVDAQVAAGSGNEKILVASVGTTAGSLSITLPNAARVTQIRFNITTPYSGGGVTGVTFGISGDDDRFNAASEILHDETGLNIVELMDAALGSAQDVHVGFTGGTPTAGAGEVFVYYRQP